MHRRDPEIRIRAGDCLQRRGSGSITADALHCEVRTTATDLHRHRRQVQHVVHSPDEQEGKVDFFFFFSHQQESGIGARLATQQLPDQVKVGLLVDVYGCTTVGKHHVSDPGTGNAPQPLQRLGQPEQAQTIAQHMQETQPAQQ